MTECEHCGQKSAISVPMLPGPDGKEWRLCGRCYIDGLRLKVAKPQPVEAPMETRYEAKDDVANFDRVPPKKGRRAR